MLFLPTTTKLDARSVFVSLINGGGGATAVWWLMAAEERVDKDGNGSVCWFDVYRQFSSVPAKLCWSFLNRKDW